MIPTFVISQASAVAQNVAFGNKKIRAKNATPVNNLVVTLATTESNQTLESIIKDSIQGRSAIGTHTDIEDTIVKKISPILAAIINTAKNTINPINRQILAEIESTRQIKILDSVNLLGTIEQIEEPELFTNEMFLELISPYSDVIIKSLSDTGNFINLLSEQFTEEEVEILCKTGSSLLDSQVSSFLPTQIIEDFKYLPRIIDVTTQSIKSCVFLFLLMLGIENHRVDKAAILTNDSNNTLFIASVKAMAACRIYRYIDRIEKSIKDGNLIAELDIAELRNSSSRDVLRVYGETYRNWLKNGGSPEAALGYLISGDSKSFHSTQLQNDPNRYVEIYQQRVSQINVNKWLDDFTTVREVTTQVLTDYINNLENADKPNLHKRLADALSHEYHGANNLHHYVIKVVCHTLTEGNDIKNLLLNIDSILVENPNTELNTAVNQAIFRLIAHWLSSQLIVSSL